MGPNNRQKVWLTITLKQLGCICSLFYFIGLGGAVFAQTPDPLSLDWRKDIKFKKAASSAYLSGSIIINPTANTRTVTGGAFDFGGNWRVGKLKIVGEKNAFINLYFPSSFTMTGTGGGNMTVNNLTMNKTNPIQLNNKGKVTIEIGGTLQISANQQDTDYTGDFVISVDYN